jgi:hypothetical protein
MADWPRHVEACVNCSGEPSRHAYGALGYCNRCYRLIRHIKEIKAWDRSRRETLKRLPKDGMFDPAVETYRTSNRLLTDSFTDDEFEICRMEYIRQLKRRLALLHYREKIRRREVEVTPLDIEHKFAELLKLIRPKAQYPQNANCINRHFNEAERWVLFALLEEVIEQAPWKGVEWWSVVDKISTHRKRQA